MTLRDDYGVPSRSGLIGRMWIVMVGVAAIITLLWLLLPDSPFTVAGTAVLLALMVGVGVFKAASARRLQDPPQRDTTEPPPSTRPTR